MQRGCPATPAPCTDRLSAVNLNGYRDAEGTWHWFGETVETDAQQKAEDALKSYAIVQYDQLFKDRSNR